MALLTRLAAGIALSLVAACARPVAQAPEVAPADAIDEVVARVRERAHVPGMAVAIVRDGEVEVRSAGVASLEWEAPVTAETRFQIASTTKLFTGTLVMMLVQEGRLELAAPVSRYLPDAPQAWRDVTVAHLAAHTSGIEDLDDLDVAGGVEVAYAAARARPLRAAPGTAAVYGRTDLAVLQLVLERVAGEPFEAQLRRRLIEPLGMTCTGFEHAADDGPTRRGDVLAKRAGVYRWSEGAQRTAAFMYPVHSYASGGLWSCAVDLARWAVAIDEGKLLDPAHERVAATPAVLNDGSSGGFSVVFSVGRLHGLDTYGHSGGPALADVVRVPDERLTVIVLANQQKLYPAVAPVIASLVLGAAPEAVAPVDGEAARTAVDRALIEGLSRGEAAETEFVAELAAALREWSPLQTAAFPALTACVLVEERADVRVYEASYGLSVRARWTVTRADDGRIAALDLAIV